MILSPSLTGGIDHSDHGFFDFLCHRFKLGPTEETKDGCGPERGDLHFAALLVDGDTARQGVGNRHVRFKDALGLLGIADFDNAAFAAELDSFGIHLLLEIMDA